jgi:hypothetical protein
VFQVDVVHQVVQGNVGVEPGRARHRRDTQPQERGHRPVAEGGKEQVEPDHVGLAVADGAQQPLGIVQSVERPAAFHAEFRQLRAWGIQLVRQDGHAQQRVALQLVCDMKPVLIQTAPAWRKRGDQTDLHGAPLALKERQADNRSNIRLAAASKI